MSENLADYTQHLGWPDDLPGRPRPESSDKVASVLDLRKKSENRRFLLGVMMAYVGMAEKLMEELGQPSVADVITSFPPMKQDSSGRNLNTLTIETHPQRSE